MSEERIKRILVALDASEANISILKAATQLAARFNAQVKALFVEDINLLRMAQLPIAREITTSARARRPLNLPNLEQQLRSQVQRLRRIVESTAQQSNLPVDFEVLRGHIATELCSAVQDMDLLVIGKNTQLQRYSEKLGSITSDMIIAARCNILLLRHGSTLEKPVAVLYTGSEASERALQVAIALAQDDEGQLQVFYPIADEKMIQDWQSHVNAMTMSLGITPKHSQLSENTTAAIISALTRHKARVFLLNPEQALFSQKSIQQLISQCQTPLLLVR